MKDFKKIFYNYKHKILKTNNIDFTRMKIQKNLMHNQDWRLDKIKPWQLKWLKNNGLKTNNTFLDYGSGLAEGGKFIIEYLDARKYFGIDTSNDAIKESKRRIKLWGLEEKEPSFLFLDFPSFDCIKGKQFDIIWSNSVLNHNTTEQTELIINNLKFFMNKNSKMYFTFVLGKKTYQKNFRSCIYNWDFFSKIAEKFNLKMEKILDTSVTSDGKLYDTKNKTYEDNLNFVKFELQKSS